MVTTSIGTLKVFAKHWAPVEGLDRTVAHFSGW